jgi:hypothetical protein
MTDIEEYRKAIRQYLTTEKGFYSNNVAVFDMLRLERTLKNRGMNQKDFDRIYYSEVEILNNDKKGLTFY